MHRERRSEAKAAPGAFDLIFIFYENQQKEGIKW